jgi:putative acetyltransferase
LPDVALRPYADSDRGRLLAVRGLAFSVLGAAHYSRDQLAAVQARAEDSAYAAELRRCNLMLAVDRSGAVLGAAGWSAHDGEDGTARVRKVFVHPDLAGRDLGTMLVRDAERRAGAAGYDRLLVRASLNAVPFYERLGYRIDEPSSVDRPGGISLPVVVMRKP